VVSSCERSAIAPPTASRRQNFAALPHCISLMIMRTLHSFFFRCSCAKEDNRQTQAISHMSTSMLQAVKITVSVRGDNHARVELLAFSSLSCTTKQSGAMASLGNTPWTALKAVWHLPICGDYWSINTMVSSSHPKAHILTPKETLNSHHMFFWVR
jgi:hypothetical protein